MGNWNIKCDTEGCSNATIDDNGLVHFLKNTSGKECNYTISYNDNGCIKSMNYIVHACTASTSFTINEVSSDACIAKFEVITRYEDGRIVYASPIISADDKVKYDIQRKVGGGHVVTLEIDTTKYPSGYWIPQDEIHEVTISTPNVEGIGNVSETVKVSGGCCSSISHVTVTPSFMPIPCGVRIGIEPISATKLPTGGTVEFDYTIVFKNTSKTEDCSNKQAYITFKTIDHPEYKFSGDCYHQIDITLNKIGYSCDGDCYVIESTSSSDIDGNLSRDACTIYDYIDVEPKKLNGEPIKEI